MVVLLGVGWRVFVLHNARWLGFVRIAVDLGCLVCSEEDV